jgi:hypothetical protein
MTKLFGVLAFLVITGYAAAVAASQQDTVCNPELFKDYSTGSKMSEESLAVLETVDSSNFDSFKQNFSANIIIPIYDTPVDFGATYGSLDEKRKSLRTVYKRNFDAKSAHAWLNIYFSENGTSSYAKCLDAYNKNTHGLHIWVKNLTPDGATVYLQWNNPPGLGKVRAVVAADGVKGWRDMYVDLEPNADRNFHVNRPSDAPVTVRANTIQGYSDDVMIPATIKVVPPPQEPESLAQDQRLTVFCKLYEGIYDFINLGPGTLEVYENCGGCKGIAPRGGALKPGEKRIMVLNNGPTILIARGYGTKYYWKEIGHGAVVPNAYCTQ